MPRSILQLTQLPRTYWYRLAVCGRRRGVFHSVPELEQAIRKYVQVHNQRPKPYLWTAKARDILEKVKRAWAKLRAGGYLPKNRTFAALDSIDRQLAAEAG